MKQVSPKRSLRSSRAERRGSTLLVVLALLGLLALLGFTFYTFAAQERAAAEYFANEARNTETIAASDAIFEWPLRQLILGPDDTTVNSVLWGGRHSLVPGMLGRDGIPFNGEGINVAVDASGNPIVDMDFNGSADNPLFLNTVDSPVANNGNLWGAGKSLATLPAPDADYSSPDINSMLLSYDGAAIDGSNVPSRVFIPTLLRPQYLRNGGATIANWYDNSNQVPATKSFRPHPDHVYIDPISGNSTNMARYVQTQQDATRLGLTSPFSFQPLDASGLPTNGQLGVWTEGTANALKLNLDVDTDGDGICESILVDLGYPPFRRGDGKLVVPLFAMQVRDLNGLINLNTATSKLTKTLLPPNLITQEFGADQTTGNPRYLSSSNQGHTASEINSVYGLSTDLSTVSSTDLQQYRFFLKSFGADRDPMTTREVANIEWFFQNYGRPQYNVQLAQSAAATRVGMAIAIETITPGLLGDLNTLFNVLTSGTGALPQAGMINVADNDDSINQYPFFWTKPSSFPFLGTPLDLAGRGSLLLPNTSGANPLGKKLNLIDRTSQASMGPNRWLSFQGYHSNNDVALINSTYAAQLFPVSLTTNQLTDDSSELIVDPDALSLAEPNYAPTGGSISPVVGGALGARTATGLAIDNDAVFGPLETAFLQQSNADGVVVRGTSRVANLATLNLTTSPNAANIRGQYTTVSSDRREYSKLTTTQTALALRPWEANYFNTNTALRPVVWYQMSGQSTLNSKAFRLSANQLLVDGRGEPLPTSAPTALTFRDLTPHPSQAQWSTVAAGSLVPTGLVTYPAGGSFPATTQGLLQQEYFARRDRQAMARDIYVLLYLYGGGKDVDPNTTLNTPTGTVYTDAQLKEMAQFAVNYVDTLDSDSVMTRFEYDKDLSDGWNLDDNPYTSSTTPIAALRFPSDTPQRGEVWGVETQQLTLAEAVVVKTPALASNNTLTPWDDTTARFFTYVDLQSSSAFPIYFNSQAWQVRVLSSGAATTPANERRVTPKTGTIPAGGLFTILTAGDNTTKDSAGNPTSTFTINNIQVIPSVTLAAGNRLDLVVDPPSQYVITDGSTSGGTALPTEKTGVGDFLNLNNTPDPATVKMPVIFQLMRRSNPDRITSATGTSAVQVDADNPWIEVDRIQTGVVGVASGIKLFNITTTTSVTSLDTKPPIDPMNPLQYLTSYYRKEPFGIDSETDFLPGDSWGPTANTKTLYRYNFIGVGKYKRNTTATVGTFTQFHFDRPFATLGELLEIPLVGPGLYRGGNDGDAWYDSNETLFLTKALGLGNLSPYNQVNYSDPKNLGNSPKRALTASAKFLQADFPDAIDANPQFDNRWYRLLEFLEVPSPMHRHPDLHTYSINSLGLPTNFGWPRVHGQLNLNFVRHASVLAGLLDDSSVMNLMQISPSPIPGLFTSVPGRDTSDPSSYGSRDWWYEFIRSRDGVINPAINPNQPFPDSLTGLYVPGAAGTRPFRGFNFTSRGPASQKQDTVFRNLPADANVTPSATTSPRTLFQIGNLTEHNGSTLDSLAKHRLVEKVMNNVTTRTNSYGAFIAVQYFEAAEETSNGTTAIRIGGRLDDTPTQRAFFVIDRTGAVEQWKNLTALPAQGGAGMSSTQLCPNSYSITPNTSTTNTPNGIDWKSLVLYRQTLN